MEKDYMFNITASMVVLGHAKWLFPEIHDPE